MGKFTTSIYRFGIVSDAVGLLPIWREVTYAPEIPNPILEGFPNGAHLRITMIRHGNMVDVAIEKFPHGS